LNFMRIFMLLYKDENIEKVNVRFLIFY